MTTQVTINNADVLRTVTVNQQMVDGFKSFTKGWPVKFAGSVPSPEMLMVALLFGKNRKPGPESGFVAMQLRVEGASVAELSAAFNSGPAHNHSRDLSADNKGHGLHYFTRSKGAGRFYLVFTAKGVKALERALQGMTVQTAAGEATVTADKPKAKKAIGAKVGKKGTSKPRKGKVTVPADVAAIEAFADAVDNPNLTAANAAELAAAIDAPVDQQPTT